MMKKLLIMVASAILLTGCNIPIAKEVEKQPVEHPEYVCRVLNSYLYDEKVPATSIPADDAYYADTLFAGDSRMGALQIYGHPKGSEVAYVTSLNLMRIDSMPVDGRDGETLMDVLNTTNKKHIYLLFGINEIRNPNFDLFKEQYQDIITKLQERIPDVQIYIMSAYHPESISGLTSSQLDQQLELLNSTLKQLAVENKCFYLDTDEGLDGDNGIVNSSYVDDGLHMGRRGAEALVKYIDNHIVRRDDYVKEICE